MGIIKDIHGDIEREAALLLDRYRDALMLEALTLSSGDSHAAEELVLQTFEAYLFGRERFDPSKGELLPWLRGILRNIHGKAGRGKSVKAVSYLSQDELELISEIRRQDNSTDEEILSNSDSEVIRKVIEALPDKTRRIIVLRCFESASFGEIARLLGISEISVKNRFYYARKLLARRLGKLLGRAPAIALGVILAGASLLYAAAVVTGLAPSPFAAAEPAAEEAEVVSNAKSTKDTEGALEVFEGLSEECLSFGADPTNRETNGDETNGDSPQQTEAIIDNSNTNTEENAVNTQMVKSVAVKALAAGAMLAAPTLAVRSARADSLKNYQVLQYLESSGTQAIDTGVKYGKSTRMRFRLQTLDGYHVGAIDACSDSQHDRFHFIKVASNEFRLFCYHGATQITCGTLDGNWLTYDINRAERRVLRDGAYQAEIETTDDYILDEEDHSTIWIFGRNGNPTSLRSYATARMGTVEIWQEDRQERLLIPCKRLRDNELGMYDLIKKEFLVNVGTGAFIAGPEGLGCVEIPPQIFEGQAEICPEVVIKNAGQTRSKDTDYTLAWSRNTSTGIGILKITPLGDYVNCGPVEVPFAIVPQEGKLPSGYQRIAYIESTRGGQQCIDTGIHPTGSMRFEVRLQAPRAEAMDQIGMIDDKGGGIYERFHMGRRDKVFAGIGNSQFTGFDYVTYVGHNWVNMILRTRPNGGSSKGWFVLDGNTQEISNIGEFCADNSTIWLFGRNSNTGSLKTYSACRLMYADIKEGDNDPVTTHHFVPCRRTADGELGVYDTVAKQFLYDTGRAERGAAAFQAGPDVVTWCPGFVFYVH